MTGTTPPTDRNLTGGASSSNGIGRPTFLVATVFLLLRGVQFCGSSATIPQPPQVETRHERSSWSAVVATFFGGSPITLSSHSNNVAADADDARITAAEQTGLYGERLREVLSLCVGHLSAFGADVADFMLVPPSPPPPLIKVAERTGLYGERLHEVLSLCVGRISASVASLSSKNAADTKAAEQTGLYGERLREVLSLCVNRLSAFVASLSSKNAGDVADLTLDPPLLTKAAEQTGLYGERLREVLSLCVGRLSAFVASLSSKNAADTKAAEQTGLYGERLREVLSLCVGHISASVATLSFKIGADVADVTLVPPPPSLLSAETEATEQQYHPHFAVFVVIALVWIVEGLERLGCDATMMICACCRCFFVLTPNWPQGLFYLLTDVGGLNMVKQFGRDLYTNLRQRYQQPTMVYTFVQSLCGQRRGQHETMPTLETFFVMILLFVIAFVIDFVVMTYTMVQYLWAQRLGQQDDMPPRRAITEN